MSDIEAIWKRILKDIYNKGHYHKKDDAEIKEILNISGFIDNPLSEVAPNYNMFNKNQYIDFLKNGIFNIDGYEIKNEALANYVQALDDDKQIFLKNDDDFIYTYPERLQNYLNTNQLNIIIDRLKENSGSNRAVAVLYSPNLDRNREHIPCLNWMQGLIRDNSLYLSVMFRSNDIYNAFPSNMYFISYIGLTLLEELKKTYPSLKFEGIYYQCSSAHYYTEFDDNVSKIIML